MTRSARRSAMAFHPNKSINHHMNLIKVGLLVSYDFQYLETSLPLVYDHADIIALAVDNERKTWSGQDFHIPDSFFDWVREFDKDNKIRIYEDNFHLPELSSIENDTRERQLLAEFMGPGGWHIQIDSDEYFIDFGEFVRFLKSKDHWLKNPASNPIDIGAFLIPIFKKTDKGFLYIKDCYESIVLATNYPRYTGARRSKNFVRFTDFYLFHQSWARDPEEIRFKVNNWGHINDFNVSSYFNLWQSIDENNYQYIKDFHPLVGPVWHALAHENGTDMQTFIRNYTSRHSLKAPVLQYWKKRAGQYLRKFRGR